MGKRKHTSSAKQISIMEHALPTLKRPMEAIGKQISVPGSYWEGRQTDDEKQTLYKCTVRDFSLAHKFSPQQPPVAAVSLQEMGVDGTGSTELGDASSEVFWMPYVPTFLQYYYATFPGELPKPKDSQSEPVVCLDGAQPHGTRVASPRAPALRLRPRPREPRQARRLAMPVARRRWRRWISRTCTRTSRTCG